MNILPIDIIFIFINKVHITSSTIFFPKKSESTLFQTLPDPGAI